MSPDELCVWVPSNRRDKRGAAQPLDGMNEIIRQSRGHAVAAARRKEENERHVAHYVGQAMAANGWVAPEETCTVTLTFVEVGRRRDPDNIFGASKFILDALCTPQQRGRRTIHKNGCGAIVDDSQEYVELRCAIADHVDRERPGVWVRLHAREDQ